MDQHTHYASPRVRREKGTDRLFEEQMAKTFQPWLKTFQIWLETPEVCEHLY